MNDVASWLVGRIGRGVYCAYTILNVLILVALIRLAPGLWIVAVVSTLAWALLAVARRCRDLGRSGWWTLVPGVGVLVCAIFHELLWRVVGVEAGVLSQLLVWLWFATIATTLLMAVWLAVARGDPGSNRFSAARSRF